MPCFRNQWHDSENSPVQSRLKHLCFFLCLMTFYKELTVEQNVALEGKNCWPWAWDHQMKNSVDLRKTLGFPGGSVVKNLPASAANTGSISGLGKSPGEGNGNPFQYSCLENPRDGGAWWASIYGVTQSWTRLKQLSSSSKSSILIVVH